MCGIVYAHDFEGNPVNNTIMQLFDDQRRRGTEGFGLFDGQEMHMTHASKEDKILKWLVKYDSNLIMFHHRNPTSTINVKRAAHPFSTKKQYGDSQYILVHNGMISNADELYIKHQELGIKYHSLLEDLTFNDSEALLWDFAQLMEGKQDKLTARGSIALVCIKTYKGKLEKLYFWRNYNPLIMVRDKHGITLSSEGEGEEIKRETLYTYNYKLNRLTTKELEMAVLPVNYSYNSGQGYGYPTSMYGRDYDDYGDRYDHTYQDNNYDSAGNWLPQPVRDKYRKVIDSINVKRQASQNLFDYEEEEIEQMIISYEPTKAEVEAEAFGYLDDNEGNYNDAYQHCEGDYEQIYEDAETLDELKEAKLLESVLDYLTNQEEWVDDNSISSIWSAVKWQDELNFL